MQLIATLGDAPTAAIAVAAIALGLLFAARGSRDRRQAAADTPTGPSMLNLQPAVPDAEPGFVGPEGTVVGHGPIRLGAPTTLGGGETAAPNPDVPSWAAAVPQPSPAEPVVPPVVEAEPPAPAEPAAAGDAEAAFPGQPEASEPEADPTESAEPAADGETADAAAEPPVAAEPEPAEEPLSTEPAWRRHMPKPPNPFRQGTIKLGGKPAGKPPTD